MVLAAHTLNLKPMSFVFINENKNFQLKLMQQESDDIDHHDNKQ